jgi:TRAP-type C4-dicarboxylate transport system permease large subunit
LRRIGLLFAAFIFLILLAVFGLPLFAVLGGISIIGYLSAGIDFQSYIAEGFNKVSSSPVFVAIPLFTFAGFLMSESRTPERLVKLTRAFLGFIPGGLAMVGLFSCAFFTAFTGGSGVTIIAIGGLLLPAFLNEKYPERFTIGLLTTGGSRGVVFPPSLPIIIYGMIAAMSLEGVVQEEMGKKILAEKAVVEKAQPENIPSEGKEAQKKDTSDEDLDAMLADMDKKGREKTEKEEKKTEQKETVFAKSDEKPGAKPQMNSISISKLFAAGILPGLFVILLIAIYSVWIAIKNRIPRHKFELRAAVQALKESFWELWIPVIIVVGIYGGFITPVEASALVAFYVFVVEVFIYRDIPLKKLYKIITESMMLVGCIFVIILSALAMTNYFIYANIPQKLMDFMSTQISSQFTFLLLLNLFLLIVGCLMDIFSAILVVVPLIAPLAYKFGVDPVHLGIIFIVNLEIGYTTPPFGVNLFIASLRFKRPVVELYKDSLPFLGILIVGLGFVTYWPDLSLWLVRILGVE